MAIYEHYVPKTEGRSRLKGCITLFGLIAAILAGLALLIFVFRFLYIDYQKSFNALEQSTPAYFAEQILFFV